MGYVVAIEQGRESVEPSIQQLVANLRLEPHPEGGYYRETWRSPLTLPRDVLPNGYGGDRAAGTLILYLLPSGSRSRLHRVRSDELWLFHGGDPLQLTVRSDRQHPITHILGPEDLYQVLVPAGYWQEAEPLVGPAGYSLVGCVVVPGFEFSDFELAAG